MRHVFIETNWVVAYAAPAHNKTPAAVELLDRAASGEIKLFLPVICIAEARRPITERFQSRDEANRIRRFLTWARGANVVNAAEDEATRRVLDRMEGRIQADLGKLNDVFDELKAADGLEIFNIGQQMLELCADLSYLKLDLQPFDQAILAAILVRAEQLFDTGVDQTAFCELDSHLQPWDNKNQRKDRLAELYDRARIWVYEDFLLQAPAKPREWLNQQ